MPQSEDSKLAQIAFERYCQGVLSIHAYMRSENQRLREENAALKAIIMRGTASDPLTAGQVAKKAMCVALAMEDELWTRRWAPAQGKPEAAKQC